MQFKKYIALGIETCSFSPRHLNGFVCLVGHKIGRCVWYVHSTNKNTFKPSIDLNSS